MPTPQMTLRVDPDRLAKWKRACANKGLTVSAQIRILMDGWVDQDDRDA